MTNKKNTRRALFMSAMSLILCFAMLMGTTFAWFTDSVTSKNNIIKSGNLDVELKYAKVENGVMTGWNSVQDATDIFNPGALWEPGHVEVAYLEVSNVGSLALKYQLGINVVSEVIGKSVTGADLKLSDHLVFKAIPMDTLDTYTDREAAAAVAGTVKGLKDYASETKTLDVNGSTYVALIVCMPETVGNEANHMTDTTVPQINLGVNLYATQVENESDSFGDNYDGNAWGEGFKVYAAQDLKAAIDAGETHIALENDIVLDETLVIPAAATTYGLRSSGIRIDLNGKTISASIPKSVGHILNNQGNLTLVGGTVKSLADNGGSAIYNAASASLTLDNVTVIGAPKSGSDWPSYAINNYGALTIKSADITSNHGALALFGDTVIHDANVTLNGIGGSSHVFYIGGEDTEVTVNGGTYTHKGNTDGSLAYIMTGTSMIVNGGTFSASNGGYGLATYTGSLTVNGGTFANAFQDWGGPITISGGTFAFKPADKYITDGYTSVDNGNGTWSVKFPQESFDSLIENAGAGDTVEIPAGTYTFPTSNLEAGMTLDCAEGTVFKGTSGLNINGATVVGATFSNETGVAASGTVNGNFKECVFEGSEALRWCYSDADSEVLFENCVIKTDFRGFHFDDMKGDVTFRNCEINGFNAYGGDGTITFENCVFGNDASKYNGLNIYSNTNLIGCTFNFVSGKTNFIDMEGTGKTLTISNCTATLDGAAANIIDYIGGSMLAQNTVKYNDRELIAAANVTKPAAPLEEDFLFPAGTKAVIYKDVMLSGDAQIVHAENTGLGLSNVKADLDHDVIVRKSGGAIMIEDSEFTLTDGAKLITVGEGGDAYQVFLVNVKVNGALLTNTNAGQYLEGISWFEAIPEWPEGA